LFYFFTASKAAESTALGAGLGIGALVVLVTLWYALPLMLRGNSLSAKQLRAARPWTRPVNIALP
jgi:hypothetical protein